MRPILYDDKFDLFICKYSHTDYSPVPQACPLVDIYIYFLKRSLLASLEIGREEGLSLEVLKPFYQNPYSFPS